MGAKPAANRTIATLAGQGGSRRLLVDSDDDMDGDDDDDDELLVMPSSSQKLELHIDQTLSGPSFPSLDLDTAPATSAAKAGSSTKGTPHDQPQNITGHANDDDLFGEDFRAQFGKDGEVDFESSQNKGSLFPRRIPLLEATGGVVGEAENDDLGLEKLSISQKHRTRSGAPLLTESTKTTYTATSSTTIISNLPSKLNMFNRLSLGSAPLLTQDSTQVEEELLEMTARQDDTLLDDLELDDVDDLLRYEEELEEMQRREQEKSQPLVDRVSGGVDTNKRKHPVSTETGSTSAITTTEDIDLLLEEESSTLDVSSSRPITEASKKTRLEYASTGSLNARSTTKPTAGINVLNLTKRSRASEAPKHDYTLPLVTGSFIKARSSSGQTFYLAKKAKVDNAKSSYVQQLKESGSRTTPLLSVPIHRMMDELDAEIKIQKQEAINRLEDGDLSDYSGPEFVGEGSSKSGERLWVDKYRPTRYSDLMGDERVNREVLSWIKEWDQCVFGRKFKKFIPEHKQQFKEFRKPDPLGRPERKILLLTGPPGLGKTTMAHVISKQAGYNVIEVNASDDRTGASVKNKIESVLQIQSYLGSDKPNLLVIDEVDGVSSSGGEQSFIKLLIDIATVEAVSKDEIKTSTKRSKKAIKNPLMRPIICICNDQYAPVLRPLRTIAQIYQFRRPSPRSIIDRLQQICEIEQVPGETRALGALYEMTEGDMRSCLNTLQFIKNRSRVTSILEASRPGRTDTGGSTHGGLTLEALNKATIGRKDQNKSLFSVWEVLFQASYARRNRSALKIMEEGREGLVKGNRMVTLIQTNGDYDKLMQGCFENYPTMIFHDVAMSKVVECGDWLAFYDQLNGKVSSNFEYEVGGYIAYALVNFHRFFAGSVRQKIEYPRKDYESFVAHKANESILQGMALNLPAKAQRYFRKSNFVTELLSPFLRILSPSLRPVNKQLIKPEERVVLMRLVEIMIHYQLTFVQEKTEDGQFVYRLEPPIDKLGDFSGIGLKNILPNRYAVRQLISQEIELELVRRSEAAKEEKKASFFGNSGKDSMSMDASSSLETTDDGKAKNDFTKEAVDFFGRTITVTSGPSGSLDGSLGTGSEDHVQAKAAKKMRIWYRFNEGFSNAVKAKVFINELL
ncbi:hypothetical protein BGX31_009398 [Mortierella sp. GBA43]|nr:hypothetical protein BGX31_009398 [Mortierella sp. GBA43]